MQCPVALSKYSCNSIAFVLSLHLLHVAEPPRITAHPKDLVNTVSGQQVLFTVKATGTKPLNYQWQYNPDTEGWSEEWQPCSGSNNDTLTIQSVQTSNSGSYRCVVSNCAGSRTSKAAKIFDVGKNLVALSFDCQ